jgi:hypothetical protein
MSKSNYVELEEVMNRDRDNKTGKYNYTYKPLMIPKGMFPVLSPGRNKSHTLLMIPGINYFAEVKGSIEAIQTKIDMENGSDAASKSSTTKK